MSPTSYQAAPPRGTSIAAATGEGKLHRPLPLQYGAPAHPLQPLPAGATMVADRP